MSVSLIDFDLGKLEEFVVVNRVEGRRKPYRVRVVVGFTLVDPPGQARIQWFDKDGNKTRVSSEISVDKTESYVLDVKQGEKLVVATSEYDPQIKGYFGFL